MPKSKLYNIIFLLGLLGLLVLIRAFESHLFYDPFIAFFKSEFSNLPYPKYNPWLLYLHMSLRYWLNSVLSLAMLYVIFKDGPLVKFSGILYVIFWIVLLVVAFLLLTFADEHQKIIFFYVRRFLIQPLFLLLFIPGFYFQKLSAKK